MISLRVLGWTSIVAASSFAYEPSRTADGFLRAAPESRFEFPRDHFAHDGYKIEWWYFTGHLKGEAGAGGDVREFGYQFTFFKIGLAPDAPASTSRFAANSMIMGHAAITDLAKGRHLFTDVIWRASPLVGGFEPYRGAESRRVASCPALAGGSDWTLDWNGAGFDFAMDDPRDGGFALSLSTRPESDSSPEPLPQGENGFSPKDPSGEVASLYYSFTRLATQGELVLDGARFALTGSSWMDHEISSDSLSDAQSGWDWFSLKFDDGRDVMLYRLRGKEGRDDFVRGSIARRGRDVRYLAGEAISLKPRRSWRSERTRSEYPVEWEVVVAGETWKIVPLLDAAENVAGQVPDLRYWEGPVRIEGPAGERLGVGYVELTGYGVNARLPL
jgi:predicted secreted hydrolase